MTLPPQNCVSERFLSYPRILTLESLSTTLFPSLDLMHSASDTRFKSLEKHASTLAFLSNICREEWHEVYFAHQDSILTADWLPLQLARYDYNGPEGAKRI